MKFFIKNQYGIAAIEFAIILPLLLLILFGVVDYGIYFYKEQIIERSISNMTNSIQQNPEDMSLKNMALSSGLGVVDFRKGPNYYCANSYPTYAEAKAGACTKNQFNTIAPDNLPENEPYYVALASSVTSTPVAAFMAPMMPNSIESRTIFKVNTVNTAAVENTILKDCNHANGKVLATNSEGKLVCKDEPKYITECQVCISKNQGARGALPPFGDYCSAWVGVGGQAMTVRVVDAGDTGKEEALGIKCR